MAAGPTACVQQAAQPDDTRSYVPHTACQLQFDLRKLAFCLFSAAFPTRERAAVHVL